ncbi:MAG: polymorphic toxin-type HINT domain-containing protein [Deltaproteobacteria bacterium]
MSRNVLLSGLTLISIISLVAAPAFAAGNKKSAAKPDPVPGAVERVLRAEVAGAVDRRTQLAETLKQHPNSAPARWQAGFVKDGNSWRSYDALPGETKAGDLLDQYRHRRGEAPLTFRGQLDLANWCRKRGLYDQEHAHLRAALTLGADGEEADILARLGYRVVAGAWLSRENLRDWQRFNQQTAGALKRWEVRLNAIVEGLSGSRLQRAGALAKLREIADPSAIPAIELLLTGESENRALLALEVFGRIPGPEASLALAKQGVFSKWPEVRKVAAKNLTSRTFEDFVPGLISLLATPVVRVDFPVYSNFRDVWFFGPVVLWHSYLLARETEDQFQVASFRTIDFMINDYVNGLYLEGSEFRASRGNNAFDAAMRRASTDISRFLANKTEAENRALSVLNERTAELNLRIGSILAAVSGMEATGDAKVWWKWWRSYADVQQSGEKPIVAVSEEDVVGNPASPGIAIISCFAAGTPVWTESGAQAIDTIKVGDRVLAKDIETGELAYKPVLQTTVRPPKELTTLRFGDETIVCTGGHRFWSSGSGWIKARDLTPQTLLHTVTGNTPVWSAKKGNTAETYNLVVADFHTYFVGKTGVLCQDLLIPHSTNSVVPGLPRTQVAAPK